MLKFLTGTLGLLFAFGMSFSQGNAAIVLTFSAPPTFAPDSGIRSINVFANSTQLAGESALFMGVDFTLGSVGGSQAVFNSPNAGTFGGSGFIGNGNIVTAAGASTFDRDPGVGLGNIGYLNLNFGNSTTDPNPPFGIIVNQVPQTILNAPMPLATLLINTSGLALGTYTIAATGGFFGGGSIANVSSSFIVAVPEPSTVLTLGICLAGYFYRQNRARKPAGV